MLLGQPVMMATAGMARLELSSAGSRRLAPAAALCWNSSPRQAALGPCTCAFGVSGLPAAAGGRDCVGNEAGAECHVWPHHWANRSASHMGNRARCSPEAAKSSYPKGKTTHRDEIMHKNLAKVLCATACLGGCVDVLLSQWRRNHSRACELDMPELGSVQIVLELGRFAVLALASSALTLAGALAPTWAPWAPCRAPLPRAAMRTARSCCRLIPPMAR